MRLNCFFFFIAMILYSLGCHENASGNKFTSKFTISPILIQASIDSTIVLDSAINTQTFFVDLETLKQIDPVSVKLYLDAHQAIKVIHYDSLLNVNSPWIKKHFRNNNVIYFEKVENNGSDTFFVETKKLRVDGSFGTEMIFVVKDLKLSCLKSEITWIE